MAVTAKFYNYQIIWLWYV